MKPKPVALPPPRSSGPLSLEETLARRRSVRELDPQPPLTWEQIGQLLWSAQGVSRPDGGRTAPSAGALYPLEMYVATGDGLFRFEPRRHELVGTSVMDVRRDLRHAAFDPPSLDVCTVFIVTAVPERSTDRYGERAQRYVYAEAGHATQNLLLQATSLGLAAVVIGAFDDEWVREILALDTGETPVYLVPVGRPKPR